MRPIGPATVVRKVEVSERILALTFDAGSDAGHTATILDELATRGIRATFALTGVWAERYPELASRIAGARHQLMNHSYDHPSFTGVSDARAALSSHDRASQLVRADEAISAATGASTAGYFRPPYGDIDDSVVADVSNVGYRYIVMWTVDSLGWQGSPPDAVARRCLDGASPGAILMFHVGSASTDAAALPTILDELSAAGYGFGTIAELLGEG